MTTSAQKFPLSMRLLHWAMAALLVSMLCAGAIMVDSLATWQPALLNLHKGFGIIALLLVCLRLIVRLKSAIPPLPTSLHGWQKIGAKASHYLLYGLMFALPLSGFLMQYHAARPVEFFGLFTLPVAMAANIEVYAFYRVSHGYLAIALAIVVGAHVAAALHHHFYRKDEVLKSMF